MVGQDRGSDPPAVLVGCEPSPCTRSIPSQHHLLGIRELLNLGYHCRRVLIGAEARYDKATFVDEKFGEVPHDVSGVGLRLAKVKHGARVGAVHLDLVHQHPFEFSAPGECLDVFVGAQLLAQELRARERHNDEVWELLAQLVELGIMAPRLTSSRRHVDDVAHLPREPREVTRVEVNVKLVVKLEQGGLVRLRHPIERAEHDVSQHAPHLVQTDTLQVVARSPERRGTDVARV